MDRPHFRPRFLLLAPHPPDLVRGILEERLSANADRFVFRVRTTAVHAWIGPPAQRVWSPCMDAVLREHPRGTLIVGRFGPNAKLMTAYVFVSIFLCFGAALSSCWGYVAWSIGGSPDALWVTASCLAGLIGIGVSHQIGTALAHEQMTWLAEIVHGVGDVQTDEAAVLSELTPGFAEGRTR